MATFKEIADKLEPRLKHMTHFQIGKTGGTLDELREEGLIVEYSFCEAIGKSSKANIIDELEIFLINKFRSLKNCDSKCPDSEKMVSSDKYIAYIAYEIYE